MNIARMMTLANIVDGTTVHPMTTRLEFCMGTWGNDAKGDDLIPGQRPECGSAACIAGFACMLWGNSTDEITRARTAREILGLNQNQGDRLFLNEADYISAIHDLDDITREEAAAAIRRMVYEEGHLPKQAEEKLTYVEVAPELQPVS